MLRAVQYVLLKANTLPDLQSWLGIRVSYGMNGVVLRAADIPLFVTTLRANVTKKPPDLVWQAWAAGKRRPRVCAAATSVRLFACCAGRACCQHGSGVWCRAQALLRYKLPSDVTALVGNPRSRNHTAERPAPCAQEVAHRPLVVYKYNMLAHIGAVSSFEVRPDRARWPACYYSMAQVRPNNPTLFASTSTIAV